MEQTAISVNLKRFMDDRGWNMVELSYEARIPHSRISGIVRGLTKNPQVNTVASLARALDVTIEDLIAPVESKLAI